MDWNQRFCPNQSCNIDFWMVQQAADNHEGWHVIDRFGGAFLVAAVYPVCPRAMRLSACFWTGLAYRHEFRVAYSAPGYQCVLVLFRLPECHD